MTSGLILDSHYGNNRKSNSLSPLKLIEHLFMGVRHERIFEKVFI